METVIPSHSTWFYKSAPSCLLRVFEALFFYSFFRILKNLQDLKGLLMPETTVLTHSDVYLSHLVLFLCTQPDIGSSVLRQAASLQLPNDFVVREEHKARLIALQ